MLGHNKGPSMEPGLSWRRHVWTRARADLMPRLPIEVLRGRVTRAAELGLPYRTYASVRASTGRDVIGFLFSSNALRVIRAGQAVPQDRQAKLLGLVGCAAVGLEQGVDLAHVPGLSARYAAPGVWDSWSVMRDRVAFVLRDQGLARDGMVVIGDTHFERDWSEAGKMAGYIASDRYFAVTEASI